MRIHRFDLFALRIPLRSPFITSLGALSEVESVVLRATTEDGLVGWGECNPFWSINGETQDTCLAVGRHLAKALRGHDPSDIEGAHAIMDRLIFGNNSIKSAFDIALHDLAAQHADLPLWKYLGGERCFDLTTDYTVSLGEPEKMAADAEAIVAAGFPVIKVKLGGAGDLDIRRIRAIRSRIPSIPLRIDANQGWD
ncbi:MAG TPA: enolase C-terminal domain-like protein, partial [Flavobacteriales bacterium]|nr:enolase C-terminal domain-like protein [Flavobacteriales bacterium]